jgi:hypothetical protein
MKRERAGVACCNRSAGTPASAESDAALASPVVPGDRDHVSRGVAAEVDVARSHLPKPSELERTCFQPNTGAEPRPHAGEVTMRIRLLLFRSKRLSAPAPAGRASRLNPGEHREGVLVGAAWSHATASRGLTFSEHGGFD